MPELFLTFVIHIILGFRELDDVKFYHDDPLVLRVLGLRRLPSTATLSRRRAGRLNLPNGALILTLSKNEAVQKDYERIMRELEKAA
ncbi:hypothetical protein CSB20_12995 [bacterium DOLZORAL124_64_63]|nr:MAG: hypothetical protein CSB20_12995 [bacterium DOLZORAL124_64_63]